MSVYNHLPLSHAPVLSSIKITPHFSGLQRINLLLSPSVFINSDCRVCLFICLFVTVITTWKVH